MPELPEVETVVRELREGSEGRGPSVVGQTITGVTVRWPRHIALPSPRELKRRLPGQKIESVSRRGKYLVFNLTRDVLLIHLKMSGDLLVVNGNSPKDKHAHTIFHFRDGYNLRFSDTRKFGKVFLAGRVEEVVGKLGPEPLERGFTAKRLGEMLAAKHRQLKPLLLDQTFIAGLGNIYTDEALHLARLHLLRLERVAAGASRIISAPTTGRANPASTAARPSAVSWSASAARTSARIARSAGSASEI